MLLLGFTYIILTAFWYTFSSNPLFVISLSKQPLFITVWDYFVFREGFPSRNKLKKETRQLYASATQFYAMKSAKNSYAYNVA